jgi:hypothetical protein
MAPKIRSLKRENYLVHLLGYQISTHQYLSFCCALHCNILYCMCIMCKQKWTKLYLLAFIWLCFNEYTNMLTFTWFMDICLLLLYLVIQLLIWDYIFYEFCGRDIHKTELANQYQCPCCSDISAKEILLLICSFPKFIMWWSDYCEYDELVCFEPKSILLQKKKLPQGPNKYMQSYESVGDRQQVVWIVCQDCWYDVFSYANVGWALVFKIEKSQRNCPITGLSAVCVSSCN